MKPQSPPDLSKADRSGEREGGENELVGARDAAKIYRQQKREDAAKKARKDKRGGYR